jgi:hypothetical protein
VTDAVDVDRIDGKSRTVRELFTSRRYNVDYYQREYGWSESNVQELLNDLAGRFLDSWSPDHERERVASYRPYFLGPIVTDLRDGTLFLVDGQQRLTTLTLLLIHLNHLQVGRSDEDSVDVKGLIASTKFGKHSFVLNIDERLECMQALFDGVTPPGNDRDESVQNLVDRFDDIIRLFPDELSRPALAYFVDWLLERVAVVEIGTTDQEMALEIFETMNDRGLRLTTTDMLKSYLLSKIVNREQIKAANDRWRFRVSELTAAEDKTETDFIKHWLRAKFADTIRERRKDATPGDWDVIGTAPHKWVRDNREELGLRTPRDFQSLVSRDFDRLSRRYLELLDAGQRMVPGLEHVYFNAWTGVTLQYPLILAAVTPVDDDETFRQKARMMAGFLDLFVARRMVNYRNFGYSTIAYTMFNLAREIRDLDVTELADTLASRCAELEDTFGAAEIFRLHGRNSSHIRYLLARMTAWVEGRCGGALGFADLVDRGRSDPFEIEHIWADHPERQPTLTEAAFAYERNSFGGLLLLPKSFNASYGDMPYESKREHYFGQNTLARSLHPRCYQNNPRFLELVAEGPPFEAIEPAEGELPLDGLRQRARLYRAICERVWDPMVVGIPVDQAAEPSPVVAGQKYFGITIVELLEARLIEPGTRLVGTRAGSSLNATVNADGSIELPDGSSYSSPSSAGAAALGAVSCNGWDFWRAELPRGAQRLSRLRQNLLERRRAGAADHGSA